MYVGPDHCVCQFCVTTKPCLRLLTYKKKRFILFTLLEVSVQDQVSPCLEAFGEKTEW
jgi:hypothetical protein